MWNKLALDLHCVANLEPAKLLDKGVVGNDGVVIVIDSHHYAAQRVSLNVGYARVYRYGADESATGSVFTILRMSSALSHRFPSQ